MLEAFAVAVGSSPQNEALIQEARLSAILLFTFSIDKARDSLQPISVQFERRVTMPIMYEGKPRTLNGKMDFSVCCGDEASLPLRQRHKEELGERA